MSGYDGFDKPKQKTELNQEQLHALLNKLSSDEQKELTDMMRNCTTEVTTTRGVPITAAVLGSLYFARTRLPKQYHFGPKGWPFYAIMGVASLTATNMLFMGMCRDKIQPRVQQLWQKYNLGATHTSYDEIRRQNREGKMPASKSYDEKLPEPAIYDSKVDTYDPYSMAYQPLADTTGFSSSIPDDGFSRPSQPKRGGPPPSFLYGDDASFMSGTPSGPSRKSSDFS
ncbi:unnamed protein product [Caenorhabditis bovis]|uniref:OCIA domain-containing protein n=1 Tax=Caenorhabditis bovis TaxID=2654633 RepID=A0A8S1EUY8_9PELO|nr:unnamed protein product [Caenorhabditis bovis]